uniref:Uncharacterized protein n=1 Tax=Anguilla anguilla TaxID=7936 RepID=A0A0E9UCX2_ANGAN
MIKTPTSHNYINIQPLCLLKSSP